MGMILSKLRPDVSKNKALDSLICILIRDIAFILTYTNIGIMSINNYIKLYIPDENASEVKNIIVELNKINLQTFITSFLGKNVKSLTNEP